MVLATWTQLAKSPAHETLFHGLGAILGIDMNMPPAWSLPEERQIATLVSSAGFVHIKTSVELLYSEFPSARQFVETIIDGSSKLTRQMLAQLPNDRKVAFVDDVAARLRRFETAGALKVPMESRLLVGWKS